MAGRAWCFAAEPAPVLLEDGGAGVSALHPASCRIGPLRQPKRIQPTRCPIVAGHRGS
jgi:hypothetical protein